MQSEICLRRCSFTWRCAALALIVVCPLATPESRAESWSYALEIRDRQPITLRINLPVQHPGTLTVHAEWSGNRVLSFRLESPGSEIQPIRRAGPSPQSFEVEVGPQHISDEPWSLSVRAALAGEACQGTLTVGLPDPPGVTKQPEQRVEPPPPPPPQRTSWTRSRSAPAGASEQERHVFEVVEDFRAMVVGPEGELLPDSCRWQAGLLQYVAAWRDRLAETGDIPPISTRRFLKRWTEAYRGVDQVRSSDDPILAGPVPKKRIRQRAWLAVRRQRIEELEHKLDGLATAVRGGHAPELEGEAWPPRLISCMAACERYFEERVRLGTELATNVDLARAQWEPISAAAGVLEALAFLSPERPVATEEPASEEEPETEPTVSSNRP